MLPCSCQTRGRVRGSVWRQCPTIHPSELKVRSTRIQIHPGTPLVVFAVKLLHPRDLKHHQLPVDAATVISHTDRILLIALAMMVVCASVIYSNDNPNARFDLDYYLQTHMPLVAKNWGPYGLKEWEITRFDEGLGGAAPAFKIQAILYWDSLDSVKKATSGEEAKTVFGDVPNFTDIAPVFTVGDLVGSELVN